MKRAYNLRPSTFKFKILEYVNGTTADLRLAEQKWLNMIKDSELMNTENVQNGTCRYYNVKKYAAGGNGFANRGKNKKGWNKGITAEMLKLRRAGLFMLLIDKPKNKRKYSSNKNSRASTKNIYPYTKVYSDICRICNNLFFARLPKACCSKTCSYKSISLQRKGKTAWNKGIPNPQAAINGKNGAMKQSATVTGRKRTIDDTGKYKWIYTSDPDFDLLVQKYHQTKNKC